MNMKCVQIGVLTLLVLGIVFIAKAEASRAWVPVSQESIDGVWEFVDYESLEVYRLEIMGNTAVLAISKGSKQAEFLFRSNKVLVNGGRVSFVAIETNGGPKLRVAGEGKVLDSQGRLTLSLVNLTRELTYWKNVERVFVRGSARARLEALIEMDARAKAIIDGTAAACCSSGKDSLKEPSGSGQKAK
jgi:hypothetical protein